MRSLADKCAVHIEVQSLTMTDGTLAASLDGLPACNAPIAEHDLSMPVKINDDKGNNNVSFTLDSCGTTASVDGTETAQRIQSVARLPPVSPLRTPPSSAGRKFTNNAAISPPFSAARSPRNGWHSQSITVFVKTPNAVKKAAEMETHKPSAVSEAPAELVNAEDSRSAEKNQEISMNVHPSGRIAASGSLDDGDNWPTCSVHLVPEMCAHLLETPRKSRRRSRRRSSALFGKAERKQKIWNRNAQLTNSAVSAGCDDPPQVVLLEEEKHEKSSASIELGEEADINASNSEVENKRNENSIEMLPQIRDLSGLDCDDLSCSHTPRHELTLYFPGSIPPAGTEISTNLSAVEEAFRNHNDQVDLLDMAEVCRAAKLCTLWKRPLYECFDFYRCSSVCFSKFADWWTKFSGNAHDEASQFVYILTKGCRNFLVADDFEPFIQDLVDTLPSLCHLKEVPSFHQAYIQTVIRRIFWTVSRSWNKRISLPELRQSILLKAIRKLETDDVNEECNFFSYEHFYVIYYKFLVLDADRRDCLTPSDLALYSDGCLTSLALQRIFSGAVSSNGTGNMDYGTFVNFLLAEVDKCHPRSIEYWFRVMDLDGDGRISFDEMEHFYSEVVQHLLARGLDVLSFNDVVNMMRDMISPRSSTYFILSDLKQSPQSARYFFNTFINWMEHIAQEDGQPRTRNEEDANISDWDRYCQQEYEALAALSTENA